MRYTEEQLKALKVEYEGRLVRYERELKSEINTNGLIANLTREQIGQAKDIISKIETELKGNK